MKKDLTPTTLRDPTRYGWLPGLIGKSSHFLFRRGENQTMRVLAWPTILFFLCICNYAAAQSTQPLPSPTVHFAMPGAILAMLRLPDGSIILGGEFTEVNGSPRPGVAKLDPDGSLDPSWIPQLVNGYGADPWVTAIAYDASSGFLYLGGVFVQVNGQPQKSMVKVSATGQGASDNTWNPFVNYPEPFTIVRALAVYGNNVYISTDDFGFVRVPTSGSGSIDQTWNPGVSGIVSMVIDASGNLFAGGYSLAKIKTTGSGGIDTSWTPNVDCYGGSCFSIGNGNQLLLNGSGLLYFTCISGLYRVPTTGAGVVDASWTPNLVFPAAIALSSDGRLFAVAATTGAFNTNATLFRVSTTGAGSIDSSWLPVFGAYGNGDVLLSDQTGGVYVAGAFASINGKLAMSFANIDASGSVSSTTASVENPAQIRAIAHQTDGSLIVGGTFMRADQYVRNGLAKLTPAGAVDSTWNPLPEAGASGVSALAVDSAGAVYVGGGLLPIQGSQFGTANLLKISAGATGTQVSTWNPAPDSTVNALSFGPSGKLYVCGGFNNIGGQARHFLAKLDPNNGSADPLWNPWPSSPSNSLYYDNILALAIDASENVYIGSLGLYRAPVSSGALDPTWQVTANGYVSNIVIDGPGTAYVAGSFSTIGGQPRMSVAKINTVGSGIVEAWDAHIDTTNCDTQGCTVDSILPQGGNVYLGGQFGSIAGTQRTDLAAVTATDGGLDMDWNPPVVSVRQAWFLVSIGEVYTLSGAASGNILVGGNFGTTSGQARFGLAVLPPSEHIFSSGFE
ncbi:MAG: delta-60 repeat domain-containing protein [Proteobacteria bacterium]|nr:delta-60 repeat domain-containing protein [Pseudomonadota bacterium]